MKYYKKLELYNSIWSDYTQPKKANNDFFVNIDIMNMRMQNKWDKQELIK